MCFIKKIVDSLIHIFVNYMVAYIPCWHIRKMIYCVLGMKIGHGSRICMKTMIRTPWKIRIGENTIINEGCYLDGRGGLIIGSNTSISLYTIILSASHNRKSANFEYVKGPVIIKDCVWVGARAIVLDNSVVEDECIIAAGSSFKGVSEKGYIYSGIPAKKTIKRELESPYELKIYEFLK